MPRQTRISRDEIVQAAVDLVSRQGLEALNARTLADQLHCSTQPIFSNFDSMDQLRQAVIEDAQALYHNCITEAAQDKTMPPYKASGMAYINFARRKPELFKLLFMRNRTNEDTADKTDEDMPALLKMIEKNTGFTEKQAFRLHMADWIFVHGLATMIVTSYLNWDEATVSDLLSQAYLSFKNGIAAKGDN